MAEDKKEYGITVNMLLPGGATITGMIPEEIRGQIDESQLLDPVVMAKPIVFLSSEDSDGLTGQRLVAIEFENWLKKRGR